MYLSQNYYICNNCNVGQDITDESVCFLSSVGNLVNFSKSGDRQAFHHLCIAVYGGFCPHSRIHGCGVLFSFAQRFYQNLQQDEIRMLHTFLFGML